MAFVAFLVVFLFCFGAARGFGRAAVAGGVSIIGVGAGAGGGPEGIIGSIIPGPPQPDSEKS